MSGWVSVPLEELDLALRKPSPEDLAIAERKAAEEERLAGLAADRKRHQQRRQTRKGVRERARRAR